MLQVVFLGAEQSGPRYEKLLSSRKVMKNFIFPRTS